MKLGNVATGIDFFDRESIREDIWLYLEDNHLVLRGVRRLGKTSVLKKIGEEAAQKGLVAAYKDVSGAENAEQFIDFINDALPDGSLKGLLKNQSNKALKWIERAHIKINIPDVVAGELSFKEISRYKWYESAKQFQDRVSDVPVIIQIDEFSVFLEKLLIKDPQEAEALLTWLRAWRVSSDTVCRFIFTGSIGVNYILEQHGLTSLLNDCHEVAMPPFKPKDAKEMIVEQVQRLEWHIDTQSIEYLCKKIGWLSPYLVNLLIDQCRLVARDRVEELEVDERIIMVQDIDDAYERLIETRSRFTHWETRLSKHLSSDDLKFCKIILTEVAKSNNGLTLKQILNRLSKHEIDPELRQAKARMLINKLEDEGYLAPPNSNAKIYFLSFLLRDYWVRNHA